MMRFLANENIPLASITKLRSAGYDVVSIIETMPEAKDTLVLEHAHHEARIILTFDRDYGCQTRSNKTTPPS
jgi:predicted nuclease of predicted toxin-antitoxin system